MRTSTINRVTWRYPDKVAFAFNPCIIVAVGASQMDVTIGETSAHYDGFNGTCYADIRAYVQAAFSGISYDVDYTANAKTELSRDIQVTCNTGSSELTFTVHAVWGALDYAETFNEFREAKVWSGYPFVFSVYSDGSADGRLLIKNDGVATSFIDLGTTEGIYNVLIPRATAHTYYDIIDFNGTISQGTFSNQFDLTFSSVVQGTQRRIMRIWVADDEYTTGVYLRWIDRHGFWQHYLFRLGTRKVEVKASGVYMRNNLLSYDQSYGYQGGAGRRQGCERQDTYEICAPLVTQAIFDALQDLTTSPVVDMYLGGGWVAVTVKAGTYSRSGEELQDFECNVQINPTPIQSL